VIAGIVVGGTSILGGEGAVWRTVLGVLFLALIGNGYSLLGLNPLYQQVTLGALILIAVGAEGFGRAAARWGVVLTRPRLDRADGAVRVAGALGVDVAGQGPEEAG
jgi:ribose transport system permease protein